MVVRWPREPQGWTGVVKRVRMRVKMGNSEKVGIVSQCLVFAVVLTMGGYGQEGIEESMALG